MRGLVICLLLGCASGANPETLVDELRVVAIVAEPPEAVPGEEVQITAWLADPEESGAYAGAWTCVGVGGECLEQDTERLSRTSELGSTIGWTLTAPVEAAALLGEGESAAATIWVLACEAGICPLLEDQDPDGQDLADPFTMMETLPLEGVSLARRSLWISMIEPAERRQNPTIEADFGSDLRVVAEETMDLCFTVIGAIDGYGYASAGGFTETEAQVDEGKLSLSYSAPLETGEVDLWVVVQSEEGGASVWTGSLTVE
jgi:hypothetical protein